MAILAIGAHPDDIEFGCYASLARFKNEPIVFIVMSQGELGGTESVRVKETQASAALINAQAEIWQYPDTAIPLNGDIIKRLHTLVEQIGPHTIFAPSSLDAHQDHRQVSQIVLAACNSVKKLLFYETPSTTTEFVPNFFYDVTDYFDLKMRALRCHKSQKEKRYLDQDEIRVLARYRAWQCKRYGRLFEAFQAYRWVEA